MMLMALGACSPERYPYSDFRTLPTDGWYSSLPLRFKPHLADSTVQKCDVVLAVRHTNKYPYSDLNLVVDLIDSNYEVTRRQAEIHISDSYGNWCGKGFGNFYQVKATIAEGVDPNTLSSIVVWPAMKGCDKVVGIENLGILVIPCDD